MMIVTITLCQATRISSPDDRNRVRGQILSRDVDIGQGR